MYMSSPVFADGVIFAHSNKKRGHFVALDAATGNVKWASDGRDGDNASVLLTPANVVFLSSDGKLTVAGRSGAKFEALKTYKISENETWAVPVLLRDGLIAKDSTALIRLGPG